MINKLLVSLHILGAIVLCTDAAINVLVHPLSVHSSTVSIALTSLGALLVVLEFSALAPGCSRCRLPLLQSYLARAICFLTAAFVMFDRLDDLPCATEVVASPFSTSASKFSVSTGGTDRNMTTIPGQQLFTAVKQAPQKGIPSFGTAFYLSRALAPRCIKIDALPDQIAGGVAWINVAVNETSRLLVLSVCGCTFFVSAIYFALALLQTSGKVGLSPSMSNAEHQHDPHSLRSVEAGASLIQPPVKKAGSSCSACSLNLQAGDRTLRCRSIDLYEENTLPVSNAVLDPHAESYRSDTFSLRASSMRSPRRVRSINSSQAAECGLDPAQGVASTPEQVFRIQRIDSNPLSARAASDTYPRPDPQAHASRQSVASQTLSYPGRQQRRDRFGYGYASDRPADFASGCIMHYPIFSQKKKKEQPAPLVLFPTLLPPDFSRASPNSPCGLTPRRTGKSRVSVSSKTTEADVQRPKDEGVRVGDAGGGSEPSIAVTESVVGLERDTTSDWTEQRSYQEAENGHTVVDASSGRLLSPSGFEYPIEWPGEEKRTKFRGKACKNGLRPSSSGQRRIGTAESGRSIVSTTSTASRLHASRPGTATSTKSANSSGPIQRRRGLLATLDLHLGSRLSGFSHDASLGAPSHCSYDSQRSCSAGTFEDGIAGDSSPLSTPRLRLPLSPSAPTSPAPFSPAFAQAPIQSTHSQ